MSQLTAAIDTTADIAGVALFDGDKLISELTWYSYQAHSRDLLPSLDWLLQRAGRDKSQLEGITVCLGPGSYAGMRVGVSTAKALAYGLGVKLIGIGRLEADALSFAGTTAGRVIPVQAAGRAELAWAAYEGGALPMSEGTVPQLSPAADLPKLLKKTDLVCGDLGTLPAVFTEALAAKGIRLVAANPSRVVAVGRLGVQRFADGQSDDYDALAPMYLRAPAIGPQPPLP